MNFKIEEHDENTIIEITAERLDAAIAPELKTVVISLVDADRKRILLDFANVSFMDSSGLGAVVSGLKCVGEEGEFVVCGLKGVVEELFKLTHMDSVFEIMENRECQILKLNFRYKAM